MGTDTDTTLELHPIATRILYEDDEVRIWDQRLDPGQVLKPHRHEHDYVLCDVSGDLIEADFLPGTRGEHDGHIELRVQRGRTHYIKKGGLETARNNGKLAYRSILIEYKTDA